MDVDEQAEQIYDTLDQDLKTRLDQAFEAADIDEDGSINPTELARFLTNLKIGFPDLNINNEAIDSIAKSADIDGDGDISFSEFLLSVLKILQQCQHLSQKQRVEAYDQAALALRFLVSPQVLKSQISALLSDFDPNQDGTISRSEFRAGVSTLNLQLPESQLKQLLSEVPFNNDRVDINQFIHFAYKCFIIAISSSIMSAHFAISNTSISLMNDLIEKNQEIESLPLEKVSEAISSFYPNIDIKPLLKTARSLQDLIQKCSIAILQKSSMINDSFLPSFPSLISISQLNCDSFCKNMQAVLSKQTDESGIHSVAAQVFNSFGLNQITPEIIKSLPQGDSTAKSIFQSVVEYSKTPDKSLFEIVK